MNGNSPLVYDLNDFSEYVDLNRFQYCFCSVSGGVLAIATETSLILTDDVSNGQYRSEDSPSGTRLVLEFNEEAGRATSIQWILQGEVVAVGFESGLLVCFNCKGEEVFEFKGSSAPVQSMKVALTELHKTGPSLWILYEDGYLVTFPVARVFDHKEEALMSYRLSNQQRLNDFVFFPTLYKASIFELDDPPVSTPASAKSSTPKKTRATSPVPAFITTAPAVSVFAVGKESSMGLYSLGGVVLNPENDKNTSVRESAVNLLSKYFFGSSEPTPATTERRPDAVRVQECTVAVAARLEFKDTKRRVLKLSADPSGSLIAASDILGRVTLFDTNICAVVRIWKGLRHAELAWTSRRAVKSSVLANGSTVSGGSAGNLEVLDRGASPGAQLQMPGQGQASAFLTEGVTCDQFASLVIHAPLLGLVYIYSMPHGACLRIIPVGLNCHVFSLNAPALDNNSRTGNVRAYLLKPLLDHCSIDLSEIRPADQEATDLDVRLTLVGTDDDDFILGEPGDPGDGEGSDFSPRELSDDFVQGHGLFLEAPGDAGEAEEQRRRPSQVRRRSGTGVAGASTAATEQCAMRNIEQSLQILVDAMPMAAMRAAAAAGPGQPIPHISAPMSRDLFDIAVERAEESLLETLAAHKNALGLTSLYKCLTMIECVELFGELSPPTVPAPATLPGRPLDLAALSDALAPYTSTGTAPQQGSSLERQRSSGSLKLTRGLSNSSLLSLTSDNSYATAAPGSPATSPAVAKRHANCNLAAAGLIRYPAFSAHLHKTLIGLLVDAVSSQDSTGKGKFHFDVSRGEITHLPTHVLQRLQRELPLRQKCLAAYEIFAEIGAAADRVKQESTRANVGFSALQALNLRQLFERAPTMMGAASAAPTGQHQQSLLSGSIFNSMSLSGSPSGGLSSGVAVPLAQAHRPLNDDIANLCKLNTTRAEAAMWALRAAQNLELEQARLAALSSASASVSAENDRVSSADSGNSGTSHSIFRVGQPAMGVRRSLTPNASLDNMAYSAHNAHNSHSKVTRISGKDLHDAASTPPALSTDRTDSGATSSQFPFFPTEYSKRASGTFKYAGGSSREGSCTGSGTGSESRLLADGTAELDVSTVSFSVFRAFHLCLEAAAKMDRQWDCNREISEAYYDCLAEDLAPKLRTTQLLQYVLSMDDHLHQGRLLQAFDLINSVAPWIVTAGPGAMNRNHSASNLSLNLSPATALRSPGSHSGPASPRQPFPVGSLPPLALPNNSVSASQEATGAVAGAILRALTHTSMRIETTFANQPANTAAGGTKSVGGKAPAEFVTQWAPSLLTPHALASFLTSSLTGDIFALNSFNSALQMLGLPNKLTGLKHIAPLFCSHLAKQPPQYLVTDVLTKKLSTFPFQRWLRDSLLTFQDSLSTMEQQRAHANRTPSIAIPNTSVTSTDSVRTSLLTGRPPVSTSAERDAQDVSQMLSHIHHKSGDKEPINKLRAPGGSGSYDEGGAAEDVTEDIDTIMQLTEEIQHCRDRQIGGGTVEGPAAAAEVEGTHYSDQAAFMSSADTLPTYDEFIRHILRPAWLYAAQCSNLEAVLTFCALVLEALQVVHDQVERRTYGAQSLKFTIAAWENLVRQTRVVLLLRSRVSGGASPTPADAWAPTVVASSAGCAMTHSTSANEFTVRNLSLGQVSLHRLLASDTLGFALRAEQALEHEDKCREVYARSSYHNRKQGTGHSTVSVTGSVSVTGQVSAGSSPDSYVVRSPSGVPSSSHSKAEVLLAWGAVADKRWKDLLSVAVAEDAISATLRGDKDASAATTGAAPQAKASAHSTPPPLTAAEQAKRLEEQKGSVRRRRPLLLYFPLHSQPHLLGGYRSIILAERWSKAIHRIDLLVSASQHLFSLPHLTWRSAVASYIYMTHIFPVFELFVALEENPQLLAIASAGGNVCGGTAGTGNSVNVNVPAEAALGGLGGHQLATKLHSKQTQQLMRLVTDMRLLKAFANTAAELLGFIETALQLLRANPPAGGNSGTSTGTSASAATSGAGAGIAGGARAGMETTGRLSALWQHSDLRAAVQASKEHTQRSAFQDEELPHIWPGQEDAFLNSLLIQYAMQVAGPQAVGDKKVSLVAASVVGGRGVVWTEPLVGELIGMLWVMHLRSLCALRGLKPSQVLGTNVLDRLHALQQQDTFQNKQATSMGAVSTAVRMEFATQCLRQLVQVRQPTGAVYVLVMRWLTLQQQQQVGATVGQQGGRIGSTSTDSSGGGLLTMDSVRLQHLSILLAAGGGSRDEEAEQMVPQIADMDVVLDTLIEALRRRLGLILSRIDQLPAFGPLIAAMDAEAVAWARNAVSKEEYEALLGSDTVSGSGSSSGGSGKHAAGGVNAASSRGEDAGKSSIADSLVSDLAAICKNLNINIASTRHLVICVQSNLLNVPVNLRSATTNIPAEMPMWSDSNVKTSWFERKTRCDALLTLCKYFAQQFAQKR